MTELFGWRHALPLLILVCLASPMHAGASQASERNCPCKKKNNTQCKVDSGEKNMVANASVVRVKDAKDFLAIQGSDDRKEFDALNSKAQEVAKASVALVEEGMLERAGSGFKLSKRAKSLARKRRLCDCEAFRKQKVVAFCSGTLLKNKAGNKFYVLTAGHCVKEVVQGSLTARSLAQTRFVFGYRMEGGVINERFSKQQVCEAKRKGNGFEVTSGITFDRRHEWAMVQLNCQVPPAIAKPVTTSPAHVQPRTSVNMLGYPSGLPLKFVDNSKVEAHSNIAEPHFFTDLDAFEANSGSGVFVKSRGNLLLAGILQGGKPDYRSIGACKCACVFADPTVSAEERVTRIKNIVADPNWPAN